MSGVDEIECNLCRSPMPRDAKVCRTCHSYQDPFRANLWLLQSSAAVLVAAASLVTSLYGLKVAKTHVPASDIRLTAPQIHDGLVTLNAINVGDAPGSLRPVTIESPYVGGSLTLTSATPDDEFVPVGGKRVSFRFHERLSARAERTAEDKAQIEAPAGEKVGGEVDIMVVGSDGNEKFVSLPIPMEAFAAHATERTDKELSDAEQSASNTATPTDDY